MSNVFNLDRRIEFYDVVQSASTINGQLVETKILYKKSWANIMDKSGGENFENVQRLTNKVLSFLVRYDKGIHEKMLIRFEGKDYDISHIDSTKMGRNNYMIITGIYYFNKTL